MHEADSALNGATLILVAPSGKILGVTRPGTDDDWGLPGGKIEEGETPEQTALRECEEESGWRVLPQDLVRDPKPFISIKTQTGRAAVAFLSREIPRLGVKSESGDRIRHEWLKPEVFLEKQCTYREYNRAAFEHYGII